MFSVQKDNNVEKNTFIKYNTKYQDLTLFFRERHKKVNNLFIAMEFTIQECKRYSKGKDHIMQLP